MTDQGPQATLLESGLTENTVLVKEPPLPAKLESQKSLEADAEPSAESSVIKQETENTHHVVTAFEPATPLATVDKSLMTSDDIPLSSKLATLKEAKKDVAASSSPGARLKDIAASSTDSDNAPLSNKVKTPQFKFSGPPRLQNVASESTDSDLPLSAIAASSKSRKPPVKLQDLSPDVVESDDLPLSMKITKTAPSKLTTAPKLEDVASGSTDSDIPLSALAAAPGLRKPTSPLRLQDLSTDVADSDDLPLSSNLRHPSNKQTGDSNLAHVSTALGDSDEMPLSAVAVKGGASPLQIRASRNTSKGHENNVEESAATPRQHVDVGRASVLSKQSAGSRDSQSHREITADSSSLLIQTDSASTPRKRSPSKSDGRSMNDGVFVTSGLRDGASSVQTSVPSLWGSSSGFSGLDKASIHHLSDPAVRAIATTVAAVILAQFEPWMAETARTVKELEKTMEEMQARADEIEQSLNHLSSNPSFKSVVPQIFKNVPKTSSPTKNAQGQYINMSELKKELPSPGIMRNLPSPTLPPSHNGPLLGNLERRIQEEYVSKVADSLVYKTMVKQQETRDLAVSVAARKISEIPGVKGEGTEDTEDGGIEAVPIRTTCQRCEGLGWMHSDTKKKHERAKNVQCRNCSSCGLCKGTGVLMNTLMCDDCNAYGFIHPRSDIPSCTMGVRCINCFDCPACDGRGLFDITPVIHSGKVNDEICDTDHVETGDKVQIPIQQST